MKYLTIVGILAALVVGVSFTAVQAQTILLPRGGGTGTSTAPSYGQVLVGNSTGTYTLTATSSLGITAGSGSQTPWTSAIDGGGFSLTNVGAIEGTAFSATSTTATSTFAGGLNIESGGFVYDYASGNVGIGTTSPSHLLSVHGDGLFSGITVANASTTALSVGAGYFTSLTGQGLAASTTSSSLQFDYSKGLADASTMGAHECIFGTLGLLCEGATAGDGFQTALTFATPTADRTVTIPGGASFTVAGINVTQTISAVNTFSSQPIFSASTGARFNDNAEAFFGTSSDASLNYSTTQTPDSLFLALSNDSNALVVNNIDRVGTDFAHAVQTNPTIFLHGDSTNTTHWLGLTHDQTNGVISTGAGSLILSPASNVGIGTTTPGSLLSLNGIANFTAATSTFYGTGGIDLAGGCFSINGTCLSTGAGTVTQIDTTYPLTGGPINTTGTLSLAFGTTTSNTWAGLQTLTNASSTAFSAGSWLGIPNSTNPSIAADGTLAINTTTASSSLRFFDDAAERALYPEKPRTFTFATSTVAYYGGTGATTTIPLGAAFRPETWTSVQCYSNSGTGGLRFGDGTNWMDYVAITSTPTIIDLSTNNTFVRGEAASVQIRQETTVTRDISCSVLIREDAD